MWRGQASNAYFLPFLAGAAAGAGAAAVREAVITKIGDVWALGRQRLVWGDSTKADTFELLMAGAKANLVITDPPYNVNYEGRAGQIKNARMANDTFLETHGLPRVKATDLSIGNNHGYICFEVPASVDASKLILVYSAEGSAQQIALSPSKSK